MRASQRAPVELLVSNRAFRTQSKCPQYRSDGGLEVAVDDTGCGVAEERIPNLFERFYRVDPARTGQGTGLGLAIVQSIMLLHSGGARVKSQLGKGTKVSLDFPRNSLYRPR